MSNEFRLWVKAFSDFLKASGRGSELIFQVSCPRSLIQVYKNLNTSLLPVHIAFLLSHAADSLPQTLPVLLTSW